MFLKEAIYLETILKDGGLVKYNGFGHYAYLENLNQTINILKNFLS